MEGEKNKTDKTEANLSIPPKLDLKQAVSPQTPPAQGTAKKATTRIDMASAAMIPEEKSKTTRINLGTFGADLPKTIKINRPSEASTIKINRPPTGPAPTIKPPTGPTPAIKPPTGPTPGYKPPTGPTLSASGPVIPLSSATIAVPPASQAQSKRQTSRINLQEAFTSPTETPSAGTTPEAPAQPSGPKTIRIKRPSDVGATQKAMQPPPAGIPSTPSPEQQAPAGEISAAPKLTQRAKPTLKLRRSGVVMEGGETVAGAQPSAATLPQTSAEAATSLVSAPLEAEEAEPHAAFAFVSLAAVLVSLVLVYVLAAQALPQLNLPWG